MIKFKLKGGENIKVTRTEKHIIKNSHPMYDMCDELCFKAKNMYNLANYTIRQEFFSSRNIIKYGDLNKILKHTDAFKDLGSNSSQMVSKMLCKSWKSFLVSVSDYSKHPNKYLGKPRLPKYKKKDGRYTCVLTNTQSRIKDGYLYFSFKRMKPFNDMIRTNVDGYHLCTRIVPTGGSYTLEIVYEKEVQDLSFESKNIASIDLGLNNFATIVNNIGVKPIVINGKGIKSINQYYNKQVAKKQSELAKVNGLKWSKELQRITDKRRNKINYFIHCSTRYIVNWCVEHQIDTIVIGLNKEWKQGLRLGSNTQHFVYIPYELFINALTYKCEDVMIKIIQTEESYTSGTSFLDGELPIKQNYDKSRRFTRGLFLSNEYMVINADCNGAYQIMKKVFPNVFSDGIKGVHLHPLIVNV